MWPPNAPDLNLEDYHLLFSNVYETRVHNIDELLLYVWCSLEQSLIDDAVDQMPNNFACLCSCKRRTL